jgi:hypothetical protein
VREVSDEFLLNIAEVSSALVGLFLVGVFFYMEIVAHRSAVIRKVEVPYIKASTQIVLVLYALPIGLSLTLVVLEPIWSRLLFLILSILLVAANIDTVSRFRRLAFVIRSPFLVVTEVVGTAAVVALVALPWLLGGLEPSRGDLTWAILISLGTGFLGVCAMILTAFDIAAIDRESPDDSVPTPETNDPAG